jgi:hypothetical protein
MFRLFGHHQVLTHLTFTFSSVLPYIGQYSHLGIIFSLLYPNVMSCVVSLLQFTYKNIKILTSRRQIGSSIFLALCDLWMLNNVVLILRPDGRYGVWVFLPLCDLMPVLSFPFYAPLLSVGMCFLLYYVKGSFSCYFACSCRPGLLM